MIYNSKGYNYCGRALGYRYGYTDGFNGPPETSLDDVYVEDLSITHGMYPRTHTWTYAAGNSEIYSSLMGCNHQHLLETVITVNQDTQVKGILALCFSPVIPCGMG